MKKQLPDTQQQPWLRRANETAKAFQAFEVYRELTPQTRSTQLVGKTLGKCKELIERWCTQHNWVDRVKAYDDHLARLKTQAIEQRIDSGADAIAQRHLAVLSDMLDVARAQTQRVMSDPGHVMRDRDIAQWVANGVKLQRLVLGQSTSNVDEHIHHMDDRALLAEARAIMVDSEDDAEDAEIVE